MLMFVRAMRLTYKQEWHIYEQRERPDFLMRGPERRWIGIEVTHLYHNAEEARYLNGRTDEEIHPLTTPEELVDALNRGLAKKAELSYGYTPFQRLILLIRVPSPEVRKSRVLEYLPEIVVPASAFDEIWMLFYDYDHLDWADLLRLA